MLRTNRKQIIFALILGPSILALAWAAHRNRTLVLTAHPGELPVLDMNGHAYVEIEGLARLSGGSLRFRGNQIELTLSPSSADSVPATHASSQPVATGFSKDFLAAGIEQMSVLREWRSGLRNAVQQGFPVTEDWVERYRALAQKGLGLASVAVSTESDQNVLRLLTNQFNNMNALSDQFLRASKTRTYISPDTLNNDPLDQKIMNCAHSLAAMAASNQFTDDVSCR